MRYEPAVDHARLAQALTSAYGVRVTDITFIPIGFAAACYRIRSDTQQFFLKLWLAHEHDAEARLQRRRALLLARVLYDRGIYPEVAYPLPTTDGTYVAQCLDNDIALFPFLDGEPMPSVWPLALQDQWTQTLIRLHRATPFLTDVLPIREQFELNFLPDLRQGLRQLEQLAPHTRAGLRFARDRLLGAQREIDAQIKRLEVMQHRVRMLPSPFVLCHTDMGGDNLLLGATRQLFVLDWDEATVAPPEHDLHEARWLDFERILHVYQIQGGATPLYVEQFAFYLLRRALADMTARLMRLLTTNQTDNEDAEALADIEQWGFAQWQHLDTTVDGIRTTLR